MIVPTVTVLGVLAVLAGVSAQQPVPIGQCTKISSCACVYDDGTIVNLAPLERKDGRPNFSNVSNEAKNEFYSWNPCSEFSYASNNSFCRNVAVCMIRDAIPRELVYDLGDQDTAEFKVDANGTLRLTYTADKGDFKRVTEILLQCMGTSKFDFLVAEGEQSETNKTVIYKLLLASPYSCAFAPHLNPSEPTSALNAGEIFAIVVFSLIGAYVLFGVMFQAFVKKESGKRLCPNHEFWCNLPTVFKGEKKVELKAPLQSENRTNYDTIE